jgi:predicted phage terminase large subunit-like protein
MIRMDNKLVWADTKKELETKYGDDCYPKSVTFIPALLADNKILMMADPGYLANLKALPFVERERLLGGNWKIRPVAGLMFRREWVSIVDAPPANIKTVRYWDLAATPKTDANDPDFTVTVKMGLSADGHIYVSHGLSMRETPLTVENSIINLASQDGRPVTVCLPQDPGQAGKSQAQSFVRKLQGFKVHTRLESGDKITRFGPFSAQCEAGNVHFVRGSWNEEFFNALEGFPDAAHDDHADACSGAYNWLVEIRRPMHISNADLNRPYIPYGKAAAMRGVRA